MTADISPSSGAALEVIGVAKSFGRNQVLHDVHLTIAEGSIVAVLGPSGGGKTTLLRIIAGFETVDDGVVRIGGTTATSARLVVVPERRRVGIVPQEGALFPHLDVAGNVGFGLSRGPQSVDRIAEVLRLVGLSGTERLRPTQLSGGQQQRVALARALAPNPVLIVLDEPFASLDAGLRTYVRDEVFDAIRAAGTTALLVTHDQQEALSMADQVAVLLGGSIVQSASPRDLYAEPERLDVATFVGEANVIDAVIADDRWSATCSLGEVPLRRQATRSGDGQVVIRPEQIELLLPGDAPRGLARGRVRSRSFFGHDAMVRVDVAGRIIVARVAVDVLAEPGTERALRIDGGALAFAV